MRLLLCSGLFKRPGWTTLDANQMYAPDINAVIPPLPEAVMRQRWDEIMWIHGPSSFFRWETELILIGLASVIKPGGVLVTECPDAEKCMRDGDIHGLFGTQDSGNPLLANKYGWSPETLSKAMIDAGFHEVAMLPAQYHVPARDFRLEARK